MEEQYIFSSTAKRRILTWGIIGLVVFVAGIFIAPMMAGESEGGHDGHGNTGMAIGNMIYDANPDENLSHAGDHDDHAEAGHEEDSHATAGHDDHGGEEHHGSSTLHKRIVANVWINNMFFFGIAIIGVFFLALQYAAQAGWSATIKRVPEAFGAWLPFAAITIIASYFLFKGDIFHWTHTDLYEEGGSHFDPIINGKKGFFFFPLAETPGIPVFFLVRMFAYFGIWIGMFYLIRQASLKEDLEGGTSYWWKMRKYSAIFLVLFAVTSSTAAWDWIMSIDTHWFSTMFGWYVFASWFVTGLSVITLIVVLLKENGYLKMVTANHLHDLGKFIFAFSIFWTYIWISQFLLIYYANIPEETIYFVERWKTDTYAPFFFINLILNFFFPFLVLMTRDSKRHMIFLKIVCVIVIIGHWIDFYLMIMPGVVGQENSFGLIEIGLPLVYGAAFLFVVLRSLSKAKLVAVNHPMLQESLHHHI